MTPRLLWLAFQASTWQVQFRQVQSTEGGAKRLARHHSSIVSSTHFEHDIALQRNLLCAGDGPFGTGDKCVLCCAKSIWTGAGDKRGELILTHIQASATQ